MNDSDDKGDTDFATKVMRKLKCYKKESDKHDNFINQDFSQSLFSKLQSLIQPSCQKAFFIQQWKKSDSSSHVCSRMSTTTVCVSMERMLGSDKVATVGGKLTTKLTMQ